MVFWRPRREKDRQPFVSPDFLFGARSKTGARKKQDKPAAINSPMWVKKFRVIIRSTPIRAMPNMPKGMANRLRVSSLNMTDSLSDAGAGAEKL